MNRFLTVVIVALVGSMAVPSTNAALPPNELEKLGRNAVKAVGLLQKAIVPLSGVAVAAVDWLATNLTRLATTLLNELAKLATAAGSILGQPGAGSELAADLRSINTLISSKAQPLAANLKQLIAAAAKKLSQAVSEGVKKVL